MSRVLAAAVAALAALLVGCASLPPIDGRPDTTALVDTAQTRLARTLAAEVAANPGKTGVYPLGDARAAFAARALFAAAAEKSLDVQYYIWHGDQAGHLLFEALWQAAGRGVRVRLLLDDMNTAGLDPTIAALDAHPNIEVRLYNPLAQRSLRGLNFVTDFTRVNKRMHNKSFTADGQVTIVGGRNVGNEYFGAGSEVQFADLDVLAVGAAVAEVSKQFDLYWNSLSAYPASRLVAPAGPAGAAQLESRFAANRADAESVAYIEAVRSTPIAEDLLERRIVFEWTTAKLFYDDPAKTLDTTARTDILLFPELVRSVGRAQRSIDLITPYFVPGERGTAAVVEQAGKGVKVRILTNSLAASDVSAVHAGYARRRMDLLRGGIQLFELKPTAASDAPGATKSIGSSAAGSLHAKAFAIDGRQVFVGSFNFDQRSGRLNTELGLVIDSPSLALRMAELFDHVVPLVAYEVRIAADGQSLEWIERTASGEERRFTTEPQTSGLERFTVELMSVLPIEWLL